MSLSAAHRTIIPFQSTDLVCQAKLIAANGYLKFLNLSGNNITSEGGIKLCDGLLVSASLETLNLAHNKITCSAANAFAKVISTTTSLGAIYLQRNEMKDEGVRPG